MYVVFGRLDIACNFSWLYHILIKLYTTSERRETFCAIVSAAFLCPIASLCCPMLPAISSWPFLTAVRSGIAAEFLVHLYNVCWTAFYGSSVTTEWMYLEE